MAVEGDLVKGKLREIKRGEIGRVIVVVLVSDGGRPWGGRERKRAHGSLGESGFLRKVCIVFLGNFAQLCPILSDYYEKINKAGSSVVRGARLSVPRRGSGCESRLVLSGVNMGK
ncbi:hypothetical protein Acr_15g0001240 [Actinidia rufa]|uniref:Uncharacterized protein n=1 Tax=Actinidia rufa TaxID=165716 RepID=A0A7J0FS55_9ERIC|nr:hypothetical protein Acr_15g0001240 [Actinidia rufa]